MITKELIEYAFTEGKFISLKTGEILDSKPRKSPKDPELVKQIHQFYVNGDLYPAKYAGVFGLRAVNLTQCFRSYNLKTLSRKETQDLYGGEIIEAAQSTSLRRYGTTNPMQSQEIQEKVRSTNLERYGYESPYGSPEIQNKAKQTIAEKYGVDNVMKLPEIQDKVLRTNLERYGIEHNWNRGVLRDALEEKWVAKYGTKVPVRSEEIQEKVRSTNLERYGVEQVFASKEIQNKAKQTIAEKYGVDNVMKLPEIQDKVLRTNLERYGVHSPLLSPEIREKGLDSNMKRYGVEFPLQSPKIREKMFQTNLEKRGTHNPSLDPSKGQEFYERYQQRQAYREAKVMGILDKEECKKWILGAEWSQSQELILLKELCDKESKEFTTELKIASLLDNLNVPYSRKAKKAHGVRNKNNQLIELDFWFPELRLGIEINGLAYHSVNKIAYGEPKERGYHFEKFFAFHSSGIKMVSFTDQDLNLRWNSVVNIIKHHLKHEGIQDSTLVDFPDLYRSFNYGLFDYEFPENPNFEDYCEAKFIDGWEYWDCGSMKSMV